jgi:hypothetical protein
VLALDHSRGFKVSGTPKMIFGTRHWSAPTTCFSVTSPYREVGSEWFDQRHADAHTRRLVAQLKRLGHTVVLDPADSLA